MKNGKVNELTQQLISSRSLVAVALLKVENKGEYLERILNIPYLLDDERNRWNALYNCYKRTGELLKADIIKVFGFQKLNSQDINILIDVNNDDEIDKYLKCYENIMSYADMYMTLSKTKTKLLEDGVLDGKVIFEKLYNLAHYKPIMTDTLSNLENIYDEEVDKTKISTCIEEIDDLNAAFRKGTVNAVMGYTGSYKTLYCTNVSYNAIKNGLNVCYISLEISRSEMYYNFLSRYSNESIFDRKLCHTDMKFKELAKEDKDYLFHTMVPSFKEELSKHLAIVDESDFDSNNSSSFDDIFRSVESNFIEATGKGVDFVIIDHLNLLKFSDSNGMNDYSKVNHWMSYFRRNCKNFIRKHKQVCILVAVQSSRDGYEKAKNNGGSYSLTGAAEGNEIERSSENVLAIYSDSDLKKESLAKIQIIKGRNCGEMSEPLKISVDPRYYIVSDYDADKEENENEIIDVSVVNKLSDNGDKEESESSTITSAKVDDNKSEDITFDKLTEMESPSFDANLDIVPEKEEQLKQLGVNFKKEDFENQNQVSTT